MYETERHGYTIRWSPDHEDIAEQAMSEVVERFDSWSGSRYKLEPSVASDVRDRYIELCPEDDGGTA